MPLIFIVGGLLVLFIVAAVLYNWISTGYRATIDRLTLEKAGLETDKASLLEKVQLLERQLNNVTIELERKDLELQRLQNEAEICAKEQPQGKRTIEQALLDSGAVGEAGLEKAKRFLEKTGTNREVHEVLVMLDLVSPQDVLSAKRSLGKE